MTTNELKHKVIDKINELDNDSLLKDLIRSIEDSSDDNEIYRLSDNHKKAVSKAIEQIEKGDYLTNEQSNKQIDEWLNK
jgi:hypothetical protein